LRSVAILFSRHGPDIAAKSEIFDLLRDEGKPMIVLDMAMLETMLLGFDQGEDPTLVLTVQIYWTLEMINRHGRDTGCQGMRSIKSKRCAAGTLTSFLKIGRDHLPVADADDKDAPWNLFALSL
jgi:hypothetical protein